MFSTIKKAIRKREKKSSMGKKKKLKNDQTLSEGGGVEKIFSFVLYLIFENSNTA